MATETPVDCDVHPVVPGMVALLPYLDEMWREMVVRRGLDELNSISYPSNAPLTTRADWRDASGRGASTPERLAREAMAPFGTGTAILNCLYGVQLPFSEDLGAAFARAVNQWIAHEWLDRDERLRASIVVAAQSPELSVAEIERCAADRRFVQVLMLVMGDQPLGKRAYWPIYEAAQRHGLPIGVHAGSSYRHPPTPVGWPSTHTEDYVNQAQAFQSALTSLVTEGVFAKFPRLTVVLMESGWTWLPAHLWRLDKFWKGVRMEVPWVDRPPSEIVRERVRLTLQPVDGPADPAQLGRLLDHMGSEEMLLFSTDYPHWQFDGDRALPEGLPAGLARKMMVDNPRATYPRLSV
ncbi:MAG: amidohydrolase [Alphaproteobacteria bacterium]|nr:amidohydrolase [Alphaproteobacteria bacterium]